MDALVLSGGSIKGSWQAGAIAEVLAAGIKPEIVTGISVGAINAAALAAWQPEEIDGTWPTTGAMLAHFWEDNITSPKQIARKRRWYELLYRVLTKKWAGLVDMEPIGKLLRETLGEDIPVNPLTAVVGCVNLRTGLLEYHDASDLDAVMASAMEPVGMPTHDIDGEPYVDGGVREIAPLAQAIALGADRIVAIVCQPEGPRGWPGDEGDLMKLIGRVVGVMTDEIVTNDLRRCEEINELVTRDLNAPELAGKRYIEVLVIRPLHGLDIDIMDFDQADIRRMVQQGREDAQRVLATRLELV